MKKMKWINSESAALHICQFYVYLMAADLMIASAFYLAGLAWPGAALLLGILAAIVLTKIFYGDGDDRMFFAEMLTALILLALLIAVAGLFYDLSWDGNAYHKVSIGLMKNGWNPVYETTETAVMRILPVAEGSTVPGCIWSDTYTKATWIFATGIYALTNNIECGKAYTMLGMVCVFLITIVFLKKIGKGRVFCILFALAAALNPISVQQLDSFYLDGFLYSVLYVLLIALVMQTDEKHFDQKISASLIAAAMIVAGNIKFTGLFYGGVFCIAYFGWYCYRVNRNGYRGTTWDKLCFKRMMIFASLAAVTVLVAGFNPYITNTFRYGSPLYPVICENPIDIMTINSPFPEQNHFKNLFYSLFSEMNNFVQGSGIEPKLKIPFTVNPREEIQWLNICDSRISGNGIFFSGILVVALAVIAIKMKNMKKDVHFGYLCMNLVTFTLLTFGLKESWWARYAPYIYYIVLIGLYIALDYKGKKNRTMAAAFAAIMVINACMFTIYLPANMQTGREVKAALNSLRGKEDLKVHSLYFMGTYFNLDDRGVEYIIDPKIGQMENQKAGYQDMVYKN